MQAEDPKSRRVLRAKCWIPALAAVSRRASTFLHSWWRAAIRSSGRRSTLRYARPSGISRRMNRRFYACRARIAPGQHPWVGLPTMQFECSREWGEWWVSGGVVASASAATHRPPSTGGRGGGCSFKPKNTMRTPALPHLMFERSKEGWTPCRPCMTCPVDRFRSCVLRATAAWDGTAQWMWRRRFR